MSLRVYKVAITRSPYYLSAVEPASGHKIFEALPGVEEFEIKSYDGSFHLKGVLLTGAAATKKRMELRAAGFKAD